MKRILYVRSGPYQINLDSYNSQEIGLATAFAERNVRCDVLYYHKKKNFDQVVKKNGHEIKILWRKGVRVLRSGIYPQILNRSFLSGYDAIFVSEYSQIMSVLLSRLHANVYVYNGPYYNLFKLPLCERLYDFFFVKLLNRNVKHFFCKTQMAMEYLQKKGLQNCSVVGVGLDVEKFNGSVPLDSNTKILLSKMEGFRTILYVGSISKRKNIAFLLKVFNQLKMDSAFSNVKFILIGEDCDGYIRICKDVINPEFADSVVFFGGVKNDQLGYVYKKADVFVLASLQEIFGMVLLESMYFGTPVIASASAGAKTLIENGESGLIIEGFETNDWVLAFKRVLLSQESDMGNNAKKRIENYFTWTSIVEKMSAEMNV